MFWPTLSSPPPHHNVWTLACQCECEWTWIHWFVWPSPLCKCVGLCKCPLAVSKKAAGGLICRRIRPPASCNPAHMRGCQPTESRQSLGKPLDILLAFHRERTLEVLTGLLINSCSLLPQTHVRCNPGRAGWTYSQPWDPDETWNMHSDIARVQNMKTNSKILCKNSRDVASLVILVLSCICYTSV